MSMPCKAISQAGAAQVTHRIELLQISELQLLLDLHGLITLR